MIKLQQLFYGRVTGGYRLLGSSAAIYNGIFTQLCEDTGTLVGASVAPFYINYIDGNIRYMVQGCLGVPDGSRETLFFHGFAGDHQLLLKEKIGIGTLIHAKAFVQRYDGQPVHERTFEASTYSLPWGNVAFSWNRERIAIRDSKPNIEIITGLLKNELDRTSWASFAFKPQTKYSIYVLSDSSATSPADRKLLTLDGSTVFVAPAERKPLSPPPVASAPVTRGHGKALAVLFVLSFLGNVVLACAFATMYWGKKPPEQPKQQVIEKIVEKTVCKDAPSKPGLTREMVISDLKNKFDIQYKIDSLSNWIESNDKLYYVAKELKKTGKLPHEYMKLKMYIEFVNNNILK